MKMEKLMREKEDGAKGAGNMYRNKYSGGQEGGGRDVKTRRLRSLMIQIAVILEGGCFGNLPRHLISIQHNYREV